jgi:hypothetical protein
LTLSNSATNAIDPFGEVAQAIPLFIPLASVVIPVVIVGGIVLTGAALINYLSSRNSERFNDVGGITKGLDGFVNQLNEFVNNPAQPDPRPLTFPYPQGGARDILINRPPTPSDPNSINYGRDISQVCGGHIETYPGSSGRDFNPNNINKPSGDILLPNIFFSKDSQLGGGYSVPEDIFHPSGSDGLKQDIIKDVKDAGYKVGKVGKNPDIKVEDGKITLQSQVNKKVTIKTDIPVSNYPEITKAK